MPKRNQQIVKTLYPFADKFVLAVAKSFRVAAVFTLLTSGIYVLWIGWVFSEKLRGLLDNTFWSILAAVTVTAFVFSFAALWTKFWPCNAPRSSSRHGLGQALAAADARHGGWTD